MFWSTYIWVILYIYMCVCVYLNNMLISVVTIFLIGFYSYIMCYTVNQELIHVWSSIFFPKHIILSFFNSFFLTLIFSFFLSFFQGFLTKRISLFHLNLYSYPLSLLFHSNFSPNYFSSTLFWIFTILFSFRFLIHSFTSPFYFISLPSVSLFFRFLFLFLFPFNFLFTDPLTWGRDTYNVFRA